MNEYTGICIDGPLVRQWITAKEPYQKAPVHPNSSMRVEAFSEDKVQELTYQVVEYHWRKLIAMDTHGVPTHEWNIWSVKHKAQCDAQDIDTLFSLAGRRSIMSVELTDNDTYNLRELSKHYAEGAGDLEHDWDLIQRMWLHIKMLEMRCAQVGSYEVKKPLPEFREDHDKAS